MADIDASPFPARASNSDPLTQAYRYLQRVVGVIALLLPPVVYLGDRIIDHQPLRGSISSYYYGRTGGWFVGSMCALGVFFLSYEYRPDSKQDADNKLSNVASATAIGVALFPTSEAGRSATGGSRNIAILHLTFAGVLFGCLAAFSLYHFTNHDFEAGDPRAEIERRWGWRRIYRDPPSLRDNPGSKKSLRNTIHRTCGILIILGIALVPINNAFHGHLVFFFESLAVWAFGVSWLVKSHWIGVLDDATSAAPAD